MRAVLLLPTTALAAVVIGAVALAATPALPDATPAQTIAKQKKTIATLRDQRAELRDELDAADETIDDLQGSNARLRARLAAVPDPLEAITSRDPEGLWAAVQAIWTVFPAVPALPLCGFDKASTANDALTPASFTFYRWQVC